MHSFDGIKSHDIINGDIFFEIIEPEALSYTYRLKPAKNFGSSFTTDKLNLRKQNLLVSDPKDACQTLANAYALSNNIALIERGECTFLTKAINAEKAGALAVIITDTRSNEDYLIEMIHDERDNRNTDIPVGYLLGRNGRMIFHTLRRYGIDRAIIKLPVNLTFTPPELINHPPWAMI